MKKESWTLGKLLKKIAPKIGAKVFLEPEWGVVGQITFKNGKNSFFRYNTLDLNCMGSSAVALDKDYANIFIKRMGYPIVPMSKSYFSDYWSKTIGSHHRKIADAYRYACKLGFPIILKPNSGSQGTGVSLVHNKKEFYDRMLDIFKKDNIALVQKKVFGKDYRLVVLDDKIISAYERIPLNITGDGILTIFKLLKNKQKQFLKLGRDTQIKLGDPRIKTKLKHQGLTLQSVPTKGKVIYLLDNANLSTGGDSKDVTNKVHPHFKKIAITLTKKMGLRFCGVDIMTTDNINQKPKKYWILEINSAPGLDHYCTIGKEQERKVEGLYLQVLKNIEKKS